MDTETELKVLAKIDALERMIVFLLRAVYDFKNLTSEEVSELHRLFLENARKAAYSTVEPSISDHYSAEVEDALGRLLRTAHSGS